MFVQEHNYKPGWELTFKGYNVYVDHTTRLKGGVAIMIRETSPFVVRHCEGGGKGRVIRVEGLWGRERAAFVCMDQ